MLASKDSSLPSSRYPVPVTLQLIRALLKGQGRARTHNNVGHTTLINYSTPPCNTPRLPSPPRKDPVAWETRPLKLSHINSLCVTRSRTRVPRARPCLAKPRLLTKRARRTRKKWRSLRFPLGQILDLKESKLRGVLIHYPLVPTSFIFVVKCPMLPTAAPCQPQPTLFLRILVIPITWQVPISPSSRRTSPSSSILPTMPAFQLSIIPRV